MSAAQSQTDGQWPEPLRRFAVDGRLQFRSNGPHLYVWVAVPFALALLFCGVAGVTGVVEVTQGIVRYGASVAALALGIAVVLSFTYSFRGRLEIGRDEETWIVVSRLGRWSRRRRFKASDVRHVETYDPGPDVIWPGSCGPQLRVHLRHDERPIAVAGGLLLDATTLDAISQWLGPSV